MDIAPIATTISALTESESIGSVNPSPLDAGNNPLEIGDRGEAVVDRLRRREAMIQFNGHSVGLLVLRCRAICSARVASAGQLPARARQRQRSRCDTERAGAAAKAGHDLVIHVDLLGGDARGRRGPRPTRAWSSTADATSLRVVEGTGGMQALGDDDMREHPADHRRRGPQAPGHQLPLDRRRDRRRRRRDRASRAS